MKKTFLYLTAAAAMSGIVHAQSDFEKDLEKFKPKKSEGSPAEILKKHATGSKKTSYDQDELSADVQDLIQEQTDDKVIQLLEKAEMLMGEATDKLEGKDTGGETIAIETEIIELIYEAAKQKQQQQSSNGQQPQDSAMMEMLQRMMGKQPGEGEGQGEQPGQQPGSKGGEGMTGDSDMAHKDVDGNADGKSSVRRVPKSSGTAGSALPRELHKALDAFNKATSEKANR
ncbi:hypothetical protein SAMN02745181_2708 [Rubritalea squalenifaciens DSM 18772]|uniref:Uncharacterized protein n=2 Tax=Rubritalea TaxID=361050 RepID=A0A1M6MEQ2_9BACT|nr:DUF4175 domain-containing protein [Rubritalea squalenifaciens]SHJ81934.1 hypothetical protein SAMN02745181_2708 [Rubritalea squalenifaciens DSM 18772]